MKVLHPSRLALGAALIVLLAATPAFARFRQPRFGPPPPPPQNRAAARSAQAGRPGPNVAQPQREQHLEQWMDNHRNLSLPDMQRALQNEPGFRELPPQVQQNRLNALGRLYNMTPQQRHQMLNSVEGLERLSPQQQQQWDHAVQQLHASPVPRRSLMIHTIADLREMPPNERDQVIDSPRFAAEFSPDERQTIRTVLTAYPPGP